MSDQSTPNQANRQDDKLREEDLIELKREYARVLRIRGELDAKENRLRAKLAELEEAKAAFFRQAQQDLQDYYEVRDLPEVKAYLEAKRCKRN